jgi:hypothetical protein
LLLVFLRVCGSGLGVPGLAGCFLGSGWLFKVLCTGRKMWVGGGGGEGVGGGRGRGRMGGAALVCWNGIGLGSFGYLSIF